MAKLMNTYNRLPVAFTRGQGTSLFDENGKCYLDALAGIAVSTLGHDHPRLTRAIAEQSACVLHTSNSYRIPLQEELAERLVLLSGMEQAFFCNSGCEANEAAIKLARMYAHHKGIAQPVIIVMENAFHGRTLATLSATGNRKTQAGFEPLVGGFVRVPYNDLEAIERLAEHNGNVVAVMLEVVQGEGGMRAVSNDYLRQLRALCSQREWLLICDEVQCGMGRTGRWFAYQAAEVLPDVVTLAKGLASGVPMGACLARGLAADLFGPGNHGSTFGGNPLACAAALETLAVLQEEGLVDKAAQLGQFIIQGLNDGLSGVEGFVAVRGKGLMIGVELGRPCGELVTQALEAGLLINVTAERVVRLLPPMIFTQQDAQRLLELLLPLIRQFLRA